MANCKSNQYKNERRRITKTLSREGLFISKYVQVKYRDIYNEAALLYNQINERYPQKPDLRRTVEFRMWKNKFAIANGEPIAYIPRPKQYKYATTDHPSITLPESSDPVLKPKENQQTHDQLTGMTMCLNIPLIPIPAQRTNISETVIQEGDQTTDPSLPDHITPESMDEQTTDPSLSDHITPESMDEQTMDPSLPDHITPESMDEQTTDPSLSDHITPESKDDETLDPSLLDQLNPETIEKIIRELREDPNLQDLMNDVENTIQDETNTEEEIIGLTIDLPELNDPLEEELQFW